MFKTIRGLTFAAAAVTAVMALPASAQSAAQPAPTATAVAAPAADSAATPAAAKAPDITHVAPTPGIGQPTESILLQPQETQIGREAAQMHNYILVPMMIVISALVLVLLLWVVVRYRASANPTPSKTSHNTFIEVVWTLLPVLILVAIAVPSIRLIAHQYSPPKADLTIKVIGNQWYWTYQYPDNGDFEVVSNMLPEKADAGTKRFRTDADGPRLLAVDERMIVPVGAVVKIITTSNDVIHSFALPAAWVKMDAVPGRLNETWFKIDRPGVYFGQCSELCGARHAYMPIAVEVVSQAQFAQWVSSKGGTLAKKGVAAANPDATSETSPAVAGSGKPEPTNAGGLTDTGPTQNGTEKPAATTQAAVAQN